MQTSFYQNQEEPVNIWSKQHILFYCSSHPKKKKKIRVVQVEAEEVSLQRCGGTLAFRCNPLEVLGKVKSNRRGKFVNY